MELIEIEAFLEVEATGNITRAAASLNISQPAVTRRLRLLELELGTKLFHRTATGVTLTDAGEAFRPFAIGAMANLRDGIAAIEALSHGTAGSVSLALVGTLASTRLTESIQTYRAAHPGVRLKLVTARSAEVTDLVQRGEVDLGLRYFAPDSAGIESFHVADEPMTIVCAASNVLAAQGNVRLAELSGGSWITFPLDRGSSGEPFARELERLLAQSAAENPEVVEIDSLTAQKRLVELDFGIAIMPQSAVEEELRLGSISRVAVADFAGTVPVYLQRREDGFISHAARGLADFLTGAR